MIKLHLGCGTKHIDGFTNIDIRYLPGVDEVNNIRFLRNYKNNTVDLIYACHVLEHFSRWEYKNALTRWYEILKPGGVLRLAVPNFSAIASRYIQIGNLQEIMGLLYGGQDYDENYHFVTFDINSITNDLTNIGFKIVKEYDHKLTEHALIDDFSQAYLPHLDPNGKLMSLNIEATK
jgi:predicted SAM-dependent methyltransferase